MVTDIKELERQAMDGARQMSEPHARPLRQSEIIRRLLDRQSHGEPQVSFKQAPPTSTRPDPAWYCDGLVIDQREGETIEDMLNRASIYRDRITAELNGGAGTPFGDEPVPF